MPNQIKDVLFRIKEWGTNGFSTEFKCKNCLIAQNLADGFIENIDQCAVGATAKSIGVAVPNPNPKMNEQDVIPNTKQIDIQMLSGQSSLTASMFFTHLAGKCAQRRK